jgi:Beta-galactosidase, domain 3
MYLRVTVVVQGPYLVRSVAIERDTLEISGDWANTTDLEVFAPSSVSQLVFNGQLVRTTRTSYGSLIGQLGACQASVTTLQSLLLPLVNWKMNDGLPERSPSYDDSRWTGTVLFFIFLIVGSSTNIHSCGS